MNKYNNNNMVTSIVKSNYTWGDFTCSDLLRCSLECVDRISRERGTYKLLTIPDPLRTGVNQVTQDTALKVPLQDWVRGVIYSTHLPDCNTHTGFRTATLELANCM